MPRRLVRSISLSHELDRFVTDEVASGHYATASEVVRDGLRALIEQRTSGRIVHAQVRRG
ncbi:type II toxin-antitoxin system ParD family antitoxin [Sphingomonas sanguinis]|uniref:Type II toxin-antitoxin system ParD family antitoxin n=2 Tax=Sphingomonas sanguinis TaxID=33051 RepID=A0ABU5LN13_9SPHN|nr:type II toxin-antitoxin system ParD family antitoxin [Sphingomonas sanguinis]